jgi:hypothetical protein
MGYRGKVRSGQKRTWWQVSEMSLCPQRRKFVRASDVRQDPKADSYIAANISLLDHPWRRRAPGKRAEALSLMTERGPAL